ncbi:DUF5991 domain-containing protein [Oscillospiraceae bacterium WX1]
MKKYRIILILIYLICLVLCACSGLTSPAQPAALSNSANPVSPDADLNSWVGDYSFSEHSDPDENMFYSITIFQKNHQYFADIFIDGFQTMIRMQATVSGDAQAINLTFDKYLPDNLDEPYQQGDLLLTLEKNNDVIVTYWEKLQPMLPQNTENGNVYFTK